MAEVVINNNDASNNILDNAMAKQQGIKMESHDIMTVFAAILFFAFLFLLISISLSLLKISGVI